MAHLAKYLKNKYFKIQNSHKKDIDGSKDQDINISKLLPASLSDSNHHLQNNIDTHLDSNKIISHQKVIQQNCYQKVIQQNCYQKVIQQNCYQKVIQQNSHQKDINISKLLPASLSDNNHYSQNNVNTHLDDNKILLQRNVIQQNSKQSGFHNKFMIIVHLMWIWNILIQFVRYTLPIYKQRLLNYYSSLIVMSKNIYHHINHIINKMFIDIYYFLYKIFINKIWPRHIKESMDHKIKKMDNGIKYIINKIKSTNK